MQDILDEAYRASDATIDAMAKYGELDTGACGFAWVHIPDARCEFVKWCKAEQKKVGFKFDSAGNRVDLNGNFFKNHEIPEAARNDNHGTPGYPKGWQFWNPTKFRGQAVYPKQEAAAAFAAVLRHYGIDARLGSRLD